MLQFVAEAGPIRIGLGLLLLFGGLAVVGVGVARGSQGPVRATYREFGFRAARGKGRSARTVEHPYDELPVVTYGLLDNGSYVDRTLTLELPGGKTFRLWTLAKPEASGGLRQPSVAQVEAMRDLAVAAVRGRMMAQLGRGEPVEWTEKRRLTPAGVEAGRTVVPWEQARSGVHDKSGRYRLFAGGETRPVATGELTTRNVLPGLYVFQQQAA